MNNKFSVKDLRAVDALVLFFALFLSLINLIFSSRIENWLINIVANITVSFLVVLLVKHSAKSENILIEQIKFWYPVPLIFLTFKELYLMVKPMHDFDYDHILINIDRWIFGQDPTTVLFSISNPLLTELLQIVYGTFFFLPVILGINLLMKKRMFDFEYSTFIIVLGFFLSFIGYLIFPAIGPRFTIHNFDTTNLELPGIFFTNFLREIVNAGESIPTGTLNPADLVQRDVFPSGHTQMTLLVMYLSVKFKVRSKYFFIPNGILLIFSTVYLRYHYVIDLIGGFVFAVLTIWIGKIIFNWWMKSTDRQEFNFN
jgi:membrane-associated phospholipid phosphatase